jgi:hypothetical protein
MRLRKIGTFVYKGDAGLYVEAVDVPQGQPRYAAIGYGCMDEQESRALDRGAIIESAVLDADLNGARNIKILGEQVSLPRGPWVHSLWSGESNGLLESSIQTAS